MSVEKVDALARGRVYSGDAALAVGLIDQLGGFGSALARARELAGLDVDAPVVIRPKRPSGLLDYVFAAREEAHVSASSVLPEALKPFLARMFLLKHMNGVEPVALYEGPTVLH